MRCRHILIAVALLTCSLCPVFSRAQAFCGEGLPEVSIPLQSIICSGKCVPVALRYVPDARDWVLQVGDDTLSLDADSLNCCRGLLTYCRQADAGEIRTFDGHREPMQRARLHFSHVLTGVVLVYDSDSGAFDLEYRDGQLSAIRSKGEGSTELDWADSLGNIRTVRHLDARGRLLRRQDFAHAPGEVRMSLSDSTGAIGSVVDSYCGERLMRMEEFDADGCLERRFSYGYVNFDGRTFPAGDTLEVFRGAEREVFAHSVRYSSDSLYHYPLEMKSRRDDGPEKKVTYTYPFCAPDGYGPVADSLLRRNMPDAVLSVAHWQDGALVDSVSVLYGRFPALDAPDGIRYRPSAVLISDGVSQADTCLHYVAYDSLGVRPTRVLNRNNRQTRQTANRVSRWVAPDTEKRHRGWLRAHSFCAGTPGLTVDPAGDCFLFAPDGSFLSKVRSGAAAGSVIFLQGPGMEPLTARFADLEADPSLVDYNMQVHYAGQKFITASLSRACGSGGCGFFKGCGFLARNSDYGGVLDFAANGRHDIYSDIFYITRTTREGIVAHNNYNYGNFLWGASARRLDVPLCITLLGSHFHNFFLSPITRGTFDSSDDLFSITAGHHWQ